MPGRTFTTTAYRYGFNGKEKDNETYGNGNIYDYGFRIYNPRLGRFLSVDPLSESYPWYTPYQFAGNKPIIAIDLDGLEEYIVVINHDEKKKPISCKIIYVTSAGTKVDQNYAFPDKKKHLVLVNNIYADGSENKIGFQDALTKEQQEALLDVTKITKDKVYTALDGSIYEDADRFEGNVKLPTPSAPKLPAPKINVGDVLSLDKATISLVVSTTGVPGGESLNDPSKPAKEGELGPQGRTFFEELGKKAATNAAIKEIEIKLDIEIGDKYKWRLPSASKMNGEHQARKDITEALRRGGLPASVKVNVTYVDRIVQDGTDSARNGDKSTVTVK